MKMKKIFAITLVFLLLLTGCGSKQASSWDYPAETNGSYVEEAWTSAPSKGDSFGEYENPASSELPQGRKWIINVHMEAETEDLDAALSAITQKVNALGGYVENQSTSTGSGYYYGGRYRNAYLTVRVPAEQTDAFMGDVGGMTNVTHSSKNLDDITLNYVATESRIKALETEQARLLELMEQAENLYDILEIENRLTNVRYELEYYGSQMRVMDNQVDYATISLSLSEVVEYTPVAEPTFGQRIVDGFKDNLRGIKHAAEDAVVWVLAHSPTLVLAAAVLTCAIVADRKLRARRKQKRAAKQAEDNTEN